MTLHNPNPNKKLKHYIKQTGKRRTVLGNCTFHIMQVKVERKSNNRGW